MSDPASGFAGALMMKFGFLRALGICSALIGAGMMVVFKPPQTRKSLFMHGLVALGCSILFGGFFVSFLDSYFEWIDMHTAQLEDMLQFYVAVHGLLGAMSWGVVGGLYHFMTKFSNDPVKLAKDIKEIV